jgi:hypothetical protein
MKARIERKWQGQVTQLMQGRRACDGYLIAIRSRRQRPPYFFCPLESGGRHAELCARNDWDEQEMAQFQEVLKKAAG